MKAKYRPTGKSLRDRPTVCYSVVVVLLARGRQCSPAAFVDDKSTVIDQITIHVNSASCPPYHMVARCAVLSDGQRHGVEVCADQAVDDVHRRDVHAAGATQHAADQQEHVSRRRVPRRPHLLPTSPPRRQQATNSRLPLHRQSRRLLASTPSYPMK